MPDARMLQLPANVHPAIGGGGRLPRKILGRRGAMVLALVILLGLTKHVVSARAVGPDSLSALPGGHSVTAGLDVGGQPSDLDLQALADSYRVDGLANLGGVSVAEEVTAAALHQAYLRLNVAPGAALTWVQLKTLATFMRTETANGSTVYVHDDTGGGRVVAAADMLLLVRGRSWSAVRTGMTASQQNSLSIAQLQALKELVSALHQGRSSMTMNPYAAARLEPW